MAALTATVRYVPLGRRKIYWCPTISGYPSAATRSELTTGGTDLTAEIQSMTGFTVSSASIEVPDLSNRFAGKIPGAITADDSSIIFYASSTSADVRTVLPRDTSGFVVCLWEGDVPTQRMDQFKVTVASTTIQTAIDAAATVEVAFVITTTPALNVVIPA